MRPSSIIMGLAPLAMLAHAAPLASPDIDQDANILNTHALERLLKEYNNVLNAQASKDKQKRDFGQGPQYSREKRQLSNLMGQPLGQSAQSPGSSAAYLDLLRGLQDANNRQQQQQQQRGWQLPILPPKGDIIQKRSPQNAASFNQLLNQFNQLQQQTMTENLEMQKAQAFWNPLESLSKKAANGKFKKRSPGPQNAASINQLLNQFNQLQQQTMTENLEMQKAQAFWNPLETMSKKDATS